MKDLLELAALLLLIFALWFAWDGGCTALTGRAIRALNSDLPAHVVDGGVDR